MIEISIDYETYNGIISKNVSDELFETLKTLTSNTSLFLVKRRKNADVYNKTVLELTDKHYYDDSYLITEINYIDYKSITNDVFYNFIYYKFINAYNKYSDIKYKITDFEIDDVVIINNKYYSVKSYNELTVTLIKINSNNTELEELVLNNTYFNSIVTPIIKCY